MKWKKNRVLVSVVLLLVLSYFSTISIKSVGTSDESQQENIDLLATSSVSNLEILLSVFEAKNADYASYGYYPQIYSGSLQATYYALYILNAIGKLGDIDQQAVINYILSFYNWSTSQFTDENSNRYLASKIPGRYYPLSTLLQVNCYAVLSLDILNSISSINIADMLTFIWNCYHPILHGFIGQPYDDSLEEGFKVPTADNTYYAVITLDTLGFDWNAPPQDRDDITAYIEGLQSFSSSTGFYNDKEGIFDSLMEIEPNQFASYYCVKTLETFGSNYVDIIDKLKFHQHLTALYHFEGGYFDLSDSIWTVNYSNIVATAMSLELSDVTGFDDFARNDVLDFLFNNRNYRGGWEASTSVKYHELIDTFQIVRSLSNTGDISQLSLSDKTEIGLFVDLFAQERGYSLLSEDYTSVDLLYSLISSYDYFGKIGELNIQELYDLLLGTVVDFSGNYRIFACTGMDLTKVSFRSRPFDYYTEGHHEFVDEINSIRSHENLFKMLDSLKKIFKLNDFAAQYDLNTVLQDVIDSQFLDPSYTENFGAFLVNNKMSSPEWKNDLVYLKYSYYAIRTMETISQYLGLGSVTSQYFIDLGFDITALGTYVARNIVETPTELFFDAKYTDSVEIVLENLYYTIYTLNAIDQFSLDTEKINNFVVNHLNYSNAKNLYYSYKISEYLDLNINFDLEQTHLLVQNIYSDTYKEFYITAERKELNHDVFLWLCEIAKTDDVRLSASYYDTVGLGGNNLFTVDLVNLILSDFGQYSTVKLESAQLGTILLDQLGNNTYQKEVHVPIDTANYPTVEGELCAYDGAIKKTSVPFSFTTEFDSFFTNSTTKTESRIVVTIEGYHAYVSGNEPIYGSMYANVYRDGDFVDVIDLVTFHDLNRSTFTFDYPPSYFGNYSFDFYLIDPYFAEPQFVCSETFDIEFVMHFSHSVIKTETRIKVIFEGYRESDSGYQPVYSGSMYADVYRNGSFEDTLDLSTLHYLQYSTFTFDFTTEFYANYSFEFYLNYPYFTEPLFIYNESFSTEYELKFVPSITKNESCIWGAIEGYREFEHGQTPISNGSMYANIYNNGFFVETIDLLTNHTIDRSIFTFDYTPEFYAYYSFEFYLNYPYLTEPLLICNESFSTEYELKFVPSIIKNESCIWGAIEGHREFEHGQTPVYNGSMYANIYNNGYFVETIDLLTNHMMDRSTFTFYYSPVYFGNYSFEFYFYDPSLANPQLICNESFSTKYELKFAPSIIKNESCIWVVIEGYSEFEHGQTPIYNGSMYANIYNGGFFVETIDLLTNHTMDRSTFSFDYTPEFYAYYSFEFYLNYPYFTEPLFIYNESFSTEYELKFVPSIIKNESCIWGVIEGYREFEHGQTPIYNGSMYANIYNYGFFVETIDLLTNHTIDRSTFTFDYTPEFYTNYSFEFYFSYPYLTEPLFIYNESFSTEYELKFAASIIKNESRIWGVIEGYREFELGQTPVYNGSIYANIYNNDFFVEKIDLLTNHTMDRSTFTFDYSPVYFGNYSFDFYLIDLYLVNPQLICNESFSIEYELKFAASIIKNESCIWVVIEGYNEFEHGQTPIYNGSMYANIYNGGFFVETIDLLTNHTMDLSTFTFDYIPEFYAYYSFEFYLNYPYFTEPLFIYNESFSTEYELKFVPSIIKNESFIWVVIEGYREFEHGQTPVYNGSMYVNVYNSGSFVEKIDLLTNHIMDRSTFTFDYSPVYFGNYSFDFYLIDLYLVNPQLIWNATFEYRDPSNPDPYTEFTQTVIKTESRIQVSVIGYYIFVSGNVPILGGSMYAYIYLDGNYMDVFELVTFHDLNQSTFTFDYLPVYFGNYSFDFYINDPYLAYPQLICNATFEYKDSNNNTNPDPYTEFTHTVIKTESWIQVSVIGYYVFVSGNESIIGGSMYACIYRDGNYIDLIALLASHIIDQSTFTFDYSPLYFGNYSFDFYLNDPYLANPQLVCNATFEYRDLNNNTNPDPDPTPDPDDPNPNPPNDLNDLYEDDAAITLPLALGMVGATTMPLLGTYKTFRSKKKKRKPKN